MSAELISLVSQFHQIVWYTCCYMLYIKELIQNRFDLYILGAYLKSKIRYNYSNIDVSKIYIIINICELNGREHKYMGQFDYLAACNRNAR